MKRSWILILILTLTGVAQAQKQTERWHFGQYAALNFNNDTVVALTTSSLSTAEGSSSIADANGQLLLYTDGLFVYNREDSLMPNGTGLLADPSSSQAALIVPHPGNANIYYIFTTDDIGGPDGLRYSVVDLTLDNGLGDVTSKNVRLLNRAAEKISAVGSADGGYWVLAHEWPGTGFYAYKITPGSGLNTTPVITNAGTRHTDSTIQNTYGQMKFSPDGKKLALGIGYQDMYEVFDFNDTTGEVSNPIALTGTYRAYGLEFSPNSSKLYITHNADNDPGTFVLEQYDLLAGNAAAINGSRTEIHRSDVVQLRQLQLAPNKWIYMAPGFSPYLNAITTPDSLGLACNFRSNVINLDPDNSGLIQSVLGLPNFVQSYFRGGPEALFIGIDTFICPGSCVNFTDLSRNNPTSWQWSFPFATPDTSTSPNPQNICYPSPGNYPVILIVGNGGNFDTLRLNNAVKVYPLPSISITVLGDTLTVFSGVSRQWYRDGVLIPGATGMTYVADTAGSYTVVITDDNGCTATSSPIVISGINELYPDEIKVFPNPSPAGNWQLAVSHSFIGSEAAIFDDNGRMVWKAQVTNQHTEIVLHNLANGIYWLRISTPGIQPVTRKLVKL